jgi:hypothetical protein
MDDVTHSPLPQCGDGRARRGRPARKASRRNTTKHRRHDKVLPAVSLRSGERLELLSESRRIPGHPSMRRTTSAAQVDFCSQQYQATDGDANAKAATFDARYVEGVENAPDDPQQPRAMTKHKLQAELPRPALDVPLRTLLDFETRDLKFRRRELVTQGIPKVQSVLRQLENRTGENSMLEGVDAGEDGGATAGPRRRKRHIRRSRHALFDMAHKGGSGRGMTPEDVYHQTLPWDDKQNLRGVGPLRGGGGGGGTADAFSDQEEEEGEALREEITGETTRSRRRQRRRREQRTPPRRGAKSPPAGEELPFAPARSAAELGAEVSHAPFFFLLFSSSRSLLCQDRLGTTSPAEKNSKRNGWRFAQLFSNATVATEIERGTHALTSEEQASRDKAARGVPDGVAHRDPAVVGELYEADILQGAGIDMSSDAAASVIMAAAIAGVEDIQARAPNIDKYQKARIREEVIKIAPSRFFFSVFNSCFG